MASIAIIGTGYVGLTTGVCFAHLGHDVVCADIDAEKVERLARGESPILEAGLDDLLREGLQAGRLNFVLGAASAVAQAEFVYLCVPTPQGADGAADMSYIEAAASEISPMLAPEAVVVNKSTVPVGSTRLVEQALGRSDVYVVSNPEFLREGSAIGDFLKPDRVVIGSDHQNAAIRVASLYIGVPAPLMVTDPASAETIKYASNAFLATKLSFVNAVAAVCEAVGADVNDVVLGMGYDKRIGHEFLRPGPGWGGSCFVGTESVLVRRGSCIRLTTFADLASEVAEVGLAGYEVYSWNFNDPTPEFFPISAFSERPFDGDVVDLRTKMGRRLTVTADHPFLVADGRDDSYDVLRADELSIASWLPIAQHAPLPVDDPVPSYSLVDLREGDEIKPTEVFVRMSDRQRAAYRQVRSAMPTPRRWDVDRTGVLRLNELHDLGIDPTQGRFGTVNNGTFVPYDLPATETFWRVIGLFLAEGHITTDGRRQRIGWSFHRTDETDLVNVVVDFWSAVGVKTSVCQLATTCQVSISSRLLARFFEQRLKLGRTCYTKRLPDAAWTLPRRAKESLLRGLWDGDGSWSLVNGGPSVTFEYGTVSRELADGIVRLLGDLGIVAAIRIGRVAKSTVDTYWLRIAGADQIEAALFLFPEQEGHEILATIGRQAKRIRPAGYRALTKGAKWVRVVETTRRPYHGSVYSLEVPGPHTVVTSFGLIAHNCFPKDTRAMLRIAKDGGYDFDLLEGVLTVNDQQFERTTDKIVAMAGGSVDGLTIAVWGLTFKANTDDLRESPSLEIIDRLLARGASVQASDPAVKAQLDGHDGLTVVDDPYAACEGASVLAVLTEWDEFRWLDLDKVASTLAQLRVVDARNLLDRSALLRRGFTYDGIGRS